MRALHAGIALSFAQALAGCSAMNRAPVTEDLTSTAAQAETGAVIPEDAELIVAADLTIADAMWPVATEQRDAMINDVRATLRRTMGFAPGEMSRAVVVASLTRKAFAGWVLGSQPSGTPPGEPRRFGALAATQLQDEDLWLAATAGGFVVGNAAGLDWVGSAAGGSNARVSLHDELVRRLEVNGAVVAASLAGGELQTAANGTLGGSVAGAALAMGGGGARAVVRGDAKSAAALETLIQGGLALAKIEADRAAEVGRTAADPLEALTGVVAHHQGLMMLDAIKTRRDGEFVELGIELPGAEPESRMMVAVAVLGVLAAVSVPAFTKYMERAKASEARGELDRLYAAAALYYGTPRVDASGAPLPCAFPPSVGVTPPAGTCCGARGGPDSDGDGRCDVAPETWTSATWKALGFAPEGQHRFVYSFTASGTGPDASFTVTAHGDLDCDGVSSTFQRMGFGDPQAGAGDCRLREPGGRFADQESE
jgi:hypothetical protein